MSVTTKQEAVYKKYGIDADAIPEHVAIIMDGNGRWAKKRLMPRNFGHNAGRKALKLALKNCTLLGVKHLTAYTFSTENWRRPEEEVAFLMKLLKTAIFEEVPEMKKEGVRIKFLGDLTGLPQELQDQCHSAMAELDGNTRIQLNIMLNYGSRNEILNGVKSLLKNPPQDIDTLTEDDISKSLYTADMPDPEILIRTSGEYRISNYLLWQIAYTEIFILDILWPDFDLEALANVIAQYQKRDRRYGGLTDEDS
ncbi:di-trans,poly-cis-decaprenylcistransferase [bacterium]|jgi:undecaprenyl diphosphate synthase|nr:di-trans,poly-cis-decaprenylcistransferase [bacterium]